MIGRIAWQRRFVAVDENGATLTSSDGLTWDLHEQGVLERRSPIPFGGGVGSDGQSNIVSSVDGIHWTERLPGPISVSGIAFGNGRFISVGDDGTILKSGDILEFSMTRERNGNVTMLSCAGPREASYTIEASSDFIRWRVLTNLIGGQEAFDIPSAESTREFFRAYFR